MLTSAEGRKLNGGDILMWRKRARLTQEEAARAMGMHRTALVAIEKRNFELTQTEYLRMLKVLDVYVKALESQPAGV